MSVANVISILRKPRWLVAVGKMIGFFCVACVAAEVSESAEPLRYQCEPKLKFSYEVQVSIELPIEKLSAKDQEAVIKLNEELSRLENPFEPKAPVENPFEPK